MRDQRAMVSETLAAYPPKLKGEDRDIARRTIAREDPGRADRQRADDPLQRGSSRPRSRPPAGSAVPRVVIVVGPSGAATDRYRAQAREAAAVARRYTADVTELYSPNATWPAVRHALQGASVVIYMGHGNGWPSPYRDALYPPTQNGFGLNPSAGGNVQTIGREKLVRPIQRVRLRTISLPIDPARDRANTATAARAANTRTDSAAPRGTPSCRATSCASGRAPRPMSPTRSWRTPVFSMNSTRCPSAASRDMISWCPCQMKSQSIDEMQMMSCRWVISARPWRLPSSTSLGRQPFLGDLLDAVARLRRCAVRRRPSAPRAPGRAGRRRSRRQIQRCHRAPRAGRRRPVITVSVEPGSRDATTGSPHAIASSSAMGRPSRAEGRGCRLGVASRCPLVPTHPAEAPINSCQLIMDNDVRRQLLQRLEVVPKRLLHEVVLLDAGARTVDRMDRFSRRRRFSMMGCAPVFAAQLGRLRNARWRLAPSVHQEMPVESERLNDAQALHQRERGAVREAEVLIRKPLGDVPCGPMSVASKGRTGTRASRSVSQNLTAAGRPRWDAMSVQASAITRSDVTNRPGTASDR